jgi:TonB family protein
VPRLAALAVTAARRYDDGSLQELNPKEMPIMTRQRSRLIMRAAIAAAMATIVLDRGALAQGTAPRPIELPPYKGTLKDDYYPEYARGHALQGRVLVEFNVDGRGVPKDVVVVNAEPARNFDDSARRLVKNLRYEVPAGWEQSAGAHRFRMGVRYQVIQCINFSHCESEPRNPPADYEAADRTYIVNAQRRVVTFTDAGSVAPPASATPASAPLAAPPPAAAPPRPRTTPVAPSEEPIYPPG